MNKRNFIVNIYFNDGTSCRYGRVSAVNVAGAVDYVRNTLRAKGAYKNAVIRKISALPTA